MHTSPARIEFDFDVISTPPFDPPRFCREIDPNCADKLAHGACDVLGNAADDIIDYVGTRILTTFDALTEHLQTVKYIARVQLENRLSSNEDSLFECESG